ncbi:hypothetical protein FOA52_006351 [Chlamydomonas sp. UWO 241]|nr:hypothetical protein FOA52_006351 [Chlamydomonas sp. UWO 241]
MTSSMSMNILVGIFEAVCWMYSMYTLSRHGVPCWTLQSISEAVLAAMGLPVLYALFHLAMGWYRSQARGDDHDSLQCAKPSKQAGVADEASPRMGTGSALPSRASSNQADPIADEEEAICARARALVLEYHQNSAAREYKSQYSQPMHNGGVRMMLKVHDREPEDLVPDWKSKLESSLAQQGYMLSMALVRRGCTQLILHVRKSGGGDNSSDLAFAVAGVMQRLFRTTSAGAATLQLPREVCAHALSVTAGAEPAPLPDAPAVPECVRVRAAAIACAPEDALRPARVTVDVELARALPPGCSLLVYHEADGDLGAELVEDGDAGRTGFGGRVVRVSFSRPARPGTVHVCVMQTDSGMLGNSAALAALPAAAAAELCCARDGGGMLHAFAVDVAAVLAAVVVGGVVDARDLTSAAAHQLGFAVDAGLPVCVALLAGALSDGPSTVPPADVLHATGWAHGRGSRQALPTPTLHRAVAAGHGRVVASLHAWARARGAALDWASPASEWGGVTPALLAAALPDGGAALRAALLAHSGAAAAAAAGGSRSEAAGSLASAPPSRSASGMSASHGLFDDEPVPCPGPSLAWRALFVAIAALGVAVRAGLAWLYAKCAGVAKVKTHVHKREHALARSRVQEIVGKSFVALPEDMRCVLTLARFDFMWGTPAYHQETLDNLRAAMESTQLACAVVMDTRGRELVVLNRPAGPIDLKAGSTVTLTCNSNEPASATTLPVSSVASFDGIAPGTIIYVGQALFTSEFLAAYLTVQSVEGDKCTCTVNQDATLEGLQITVHVPGLVHPGPPLSPEDVAAIQTFGKDNEVDFVALTYTHRHDAESFNTKL